MRNYVALIWFLIVFISLVLPLAAAEGTEPSGAAGKISPIGKLGVTTGSYFALKARFENWNEVKDWVKVGQLADVLITGRRKKQAVYAMMAKKVKISAVGCFNSVLNDCSPDDRTITILIPAAERKPFEIAVKGRIALELRPAGAPIEDMASSDPLETFLSNTKETRPAAKSAYSTVTINGKRYQMSKDGELIPLGDAERVPVGGIRGGLSPGKKGEDAE